MRYGLMALMVWLAAGPLWAAAGEEHAFELTWREDGFWRTTSCMLDEREPFAAEPDFGEREVLRGTFRVSPSEDRREEMGLAWDYTQGRLYIDLNRDGDLTNDPNGVLEGSGDREGSYLSQHFEPFEFRMATPEGAYPYRISANLNKYTTVSGYGQINVQSGYEGDVELAGKTWRFRIADMLRGEVETGRDQLDILPVDPGGGNRVDSQPLREQLFLDGRCYDAEFAMEVSGEGVPVVKGTLRETEVPLGQLRIEGQRIAGLVFGNGDMLVVPNLAEAGAAQPVPVGSFVCQGLTLEAGDRRASPQELDRLRIDTTTDETAVFRAGAPLESRVTVERMGNMLRFGFELVGAGGETYDASSLLGYNRKPSVSIYKGDLLLASGQFEYG